MRFTRALAASLFSVLAVVGCGGHSSGVLPPGSLGDDAGPGATSDGSLPPGCVVVACLADEVFVPSTCSCEDLERDGGPDARVPPPPLQVPDATTCGVCPPGYATDPETCDCLWDEAGLDDAQAPDATVPDGSLPDGSLPDDASPPIDSPIIIVSDDTGAPDAPVGTEDACAAVCDYPYYLTSGCTCACYDFYCGAGYVQNAECACEACPPSSCPSGQSPSDSSCGTCAACSTTCPSGFTFGSECNCVPDGVHAGGTPPQDAGGLYCEIGGYGACAVGSWCQIGTCPDTTVAYGCYCSLDGVATCNVSCPAPPPCEIPGVGSCPYETSCTFGTCGGGSSDYLSCYCYGNNEAYCDTEPCPEDAGAGGG